MSISNYEFLSILQASDYNDMDLDNDSFDYQSVLESVRSSIAQNHADELAATLEDESATPVLKNLILKYTTECLVGKSYDHYALVERIYQDMAGLGLLTEYIRDPNVEEINLNGYDVVEIVRADGTEYLYGEDAFPTPVAALDIIKRMVRMGGMLLDAQTPRVDSYIGSGTRISAIIPPLVPEDRGLIASIRKQSRSRITRGQLIASGTASNEVLDFLVLCLCYGVSVGISGGTGSGKSTLMNFLLNEYIQLNEDYNNRIYIIEDSRELNLLDYDEANDRPARVLYTQTKSAPNPVTMFDLIVSSLRFHPALLVPAEVRDEAAYQAAIAGQTGHTILTSFHADSAKNAYYRLLALCTTAGTGLTDEKLMEMCIGAWPIVIFAKQLKDNSRKIMEVFEATAYKDGKVEGNMIFTYEIESVNRNERGHITKIVGEHVKTGCISEGLYEKLKNNGAPIEKLRALFPTLALRDIE